MGMSAVYTVVNKETLSNLLKTDPEEMLEELEEYLENDPESIDLDKLWDGLHFFLTGVSASTPIEESRLSQAIVGVTVLNEDEFTSYTSYEDLVEIIKAMEGVDMQALKTNFQPKEFKKNEIYPNIWVHEDREELFNELNDNFQLLLDFYKANLNKGDSIVVSIY